MEDLRLGIVSVGCVNSPTLSYGAGNSKLLYLKACDNITEIKSIFEGAKPYTVA